jgi:hypothetical protein
MGGARMTGVIRPPQSANGDIAVSIREIRRPPGREARPGD